MFSFGRDGDTLVHTSPYSLLTPLSSLLPSVNISWKHGINALSAADQQKDNRGRISVVLWGLCPDDLVVEEDRSPPMLCGMHSGVHSHSVSQREAAPEASFLNSGTRGSHRVVTVGSFPERAPEGAQGGIVPARAERWDRGRWRTQRRNNGRGLYAPREDGGVNYPRSYIPDVNPREAVSDI